MEGLKQIANVAGYPGLYRILKPSRSGVIVESLDGKKEKTMMGPTARVSVLNDISIYVDRSVDEPSIPLGDVFMLVNERFGTELPVTNKTDNPDLVDFMADVLPDYDREKVKVSDIKKLVNWYLILRQHAPDLFEPPVVTDDANTAIETAGTDDGAQTDESDKHQPDTE